MIKLLNLALNVFFNFFNLDCGDVGMRPSNNFRDWRFALFDSFEECLIGADFEAGKKVKLKLRFQES